MVKSTCNSLRLNHDNSVLFGTLQCSDAFTDVASVIFAGSVVYLADNVELLGVTLENSLSVEKLVNKVSRACLYHLHALRYIRSVVNAEDVKMIACSVVGSWLDCSDIVLYEASPKNKISLQPIQNALACCVVDSKLQRVVQTRCYNINNGYLFCFELNSEYQNSRYLLVRQLPVTIVTHQ